MTIDLTPDIEPTLPGRLGSPDWNLRDDPRADKRMVEALAPFGFDVAPEPPPVNADSPLDAQLEFCEQAEPGFEGLFAALAAGLPAVDGVTKSTEIITGVDGNQISLYIHRPTDAEGPLPGVLHIHGGGMVILSASGPLYSRWRDELAATGLVVVGVEFRNGAAGLGNHPFPAGLDDCSISLDWVNDNRQLLGIGRLVVSGESGGGNLTLATALKAKKEGRLDHIDGLYAMCPYISNLWGTKTAALPSLFENDGYFLDCEMMGALGAVYDPGGANQENPLCWPYRASGADVEGLPPTVISVNQLDPLRDEGLAFYQTLNKAGVSAVSRTVNGTCHAGDFIFAGAMPDVYAATIRDIKGFADSL